MQSAIGFQDEQIVILVSKNLNIFVKRYHIAMQLGNLFLNKLEGKEIIKINFANADEEIKLFADMLLMSEDKVREYYRKVKNIGFSESYTITVLSKMFIVSYNQMRRRLKYLGLYK